MTPSVTSTTTGQRPKGFSWPASSILDAYGPLRHAIPVFVGDRITCWAGTGVITHIHAPFNGVQGIHSYVGVALDSGDSCSAMLDEVQLCDELVTSMDGRLW